MELGHHTHIQRHMNASNEKQLTHQSAPIGPFANEQIFALSECQCGFSSTRVCKASILHISVFKVTLCGGQRVVSPTPN